MQDSLIAFQKEVHELWLKLKKQLERDKSLSCACHKKSLLLERELRRYEEFARQELREHAKKS